ncbi:OmpA family protein [Gluconobacter wancherniae]|uniref:OmpA family protein n=1 Tax=Gluconobacter wancherniae TaxID=1307955 RepID=UPI001B8B2A6D|nr:OmpA family protein [Gluconobacter wancherniae]MBS1094247.1 hypothetical protein [Gluconobacter wancherniae]MBS1094664.1 hypothetical protein [Gluconobacter wancherniae]
MNRPLLPLLSFSAVLACSLPCAAFAQVTSNLDNLPGGKPAPQPAHHAATHSSHTKTVATPTQAPAPASVAPKHETVPAVPAAPPPPVILPPPFVPVALHAPTPADPVKPVPDAKSSTSTLSGGGLRILFPSGEASLNEESIKAVQAFGAELKNHPEQRAVLLAYATLPGDDISMPRRIALARALSIRSLLIQAGVATTRIYPRALGRPEKTDTSPADRLDIELQSNPVSTSAAPASGTPSEKKATP